MAKNTYKRCDSDLKLIAVVEYLHQQTGPVKAADIGAELEIPAGTVMTKIAALIDTKWAKQTGDGFEPGPRISGMYAAYIQGLVRDRDAINAELKKLGVGNG